MKSLNWLLICCVALLITPVCGRADDEAGPRPYVTVAEWGQYYFKLVPGNGRDDSPGAVGTCYQLGRDGKDIVMWTVKDWYAFTVYLSARGEYLVRLGNWPRGRGASADDLAVAFYKNGQLLKSYSTADLIKDVKRVQPSVSHYQFYTGKPEFTSTVTGGTFTLTTVDNITYIFDIATGGVVLPTKQESVTSLKGGPITDFIEYQPLDHGAYQGRAKLTVGNSIRLGERFLVGIRFDNTSGGDDFYNPYFNRLWPLPAKLAIYDSEKKYLGDLFASEDYSQVGVGSNAWTFIGSGAYIGTSLGAFVAGNLPGNVTKLPAGYYYLQMVFNQNFVSINPARTESETVGMANFLKDLEDATPLFRSNSVLVHFRE